jgi:hypothetical protein
MLITFVCVGNTCRSPLLKHLFERYAKEKGFQCDVKSAGLSVNDGTISPYTKNILLEHGIEVIPTLLLFKNGKAEKKSVGYLSKTELIEKFIVGL